MIYLVIGIAIGAAFSPFWMWVYKVGKEFVNSKLPNKPV
jgi:hypothetical protein